MSKKVYCITCKYSCYKSKFFPLYSIRFKSGGRDSRNITHDTPICGYNPNIINTVEHSYYSQQKLKYVSVDDPRVLNKDNDCRLYHRSLLKTIWQMLKL